MKNLNAMAVVVVLLLAGCASAPQVPYRVPQATISGATAEQVKLPIIQACVAGGGAVEVSTDHQVICAKAMDDSFGSLMYRALMTPQYATNPVGRARYTLVESGGNVFVTVDTFLQHQNAFGQVSTTPIQNGNVANQAQAMLDRIKASIEGTPAAHANSLQEASPAQPNPNKNVTPQKPTVVAPATQETTSSWRKWSEKDK